MSADNAARDEVGEPEGVEGRKLLNAVSTLDPVFPQVEVLVVSHTSLALQSLIVSFLPESATLTSRKVLRKLPSKPLHFDARHKPDSNRRQSVVRKGAQR